MRRDIFTADHEAFRDGRSHFRPRSQLGASLGRGVPASDRGRNCDNPTGYHDRGTPRIQRLVDDRRRPPGA
jgi:hypothetical protein